MSDEGEEWKGEEPASHDWTPILFPWSRPLTKEEAEAVAVVEAAAIAKAEILFPAIPLFNLGASCVKCGNDETIKVRYCVATYAGGCKGETGKHEHFHRTCKRCRYEWLERCLGEE